MSRFIVSNVSWDEDGVFTINFLDKSDALRMEGNVWRSSSVSLSPESGGLYLEAKDILEAVTELLGDLVGVFRDQPPFVPGEDDGENLEEQGMGWG